MDTVVVTNVGLGLLTARIRAAGNEWNYLGVGTGTNVANITDVSLQTPRAESRTLCTTSSVTTTVANDTYQAVGLVSIVGSVASLTEVALFNASTSGEMFLRASHDSIALNVGDSVQYTLKIKFANA